MLARLVEAADHREQHGEAAAHAGIEHGVVFVRRVGARSSRSIASPAGVGLSQESPRMLPDDVPSHHAVVRLLGVVRAPGRSAAKASSAATIATQRVTEQVLGHREALRVTELLERP